MKERLSNKQPSATIGKIVKYFANGRWHHPFFADKLNWAIHHQTGAISAYSVITDYKVITPTAEAMKRLNEDAKLMKLMS